MSPFDSQFRLSGPGRRLAMAVLFATLSAAAPGLAQTVGTPAAPVAATPPVSDPPISSTIVETTALANLDYFSAAGRRRISLAQKARWAKLRPMKKAA